MSKHTTAFPYCSSESNTTTFGSTALLPPTVCTWQYIRCGGELTLAILGDSSLYMWGSNTYGQIGVGSANLNFNLPQRVSSTAGWKKVSAFRYHTAGIKSDGSLWTWGKNDYGQLGDNSTILKRVPVRVGADNDWLNVETGEDFTIAIKSNGTLWAWGRNDNGQLGVGNILSSSVPIQVGTATDWLKISCGRVHALAIKSSGTLWAWGYGADGALGTGNTLTQLTPIQIGTANTWMEISSGVWSNAALRTNGTLWTWGRNDYGSLGSSSTASRVAPAQVGTAVWTTVNCGAYHALARKSDGTLYGWGYNLNGQVGNNTTTNQLAPQLVTSSTQWKMAGAGLVHSAAIRNDGSLWLWGSGTVGQFGNGTFPGTTSSPISVAFNNNVIVADTVRFCGSSFVLGADNTYNSYQWSTNETTHSINASQSGWYKCTVTGRSGCILNDSVYLSIINGNIINSDTSICRGASLLLTTTVSGASVNYNWTGGTAASSLMATPTQNTTYYCNFLSNTLVCKDSITINLKERSQTALFVSACNNYFWSGQLYNQSGIYTWTGSNQAGCDSSVFLNLTILIPTVSNQTMEACTRYYWNGQFYNQSGNYTWNGTNQMGCDSLAILQLTVNLPVVTNISAVVLTNQLPYNFNGVTYTQTGTYTWNGYTNSGCDSMVILDLRVLPEPNNLLNICNYIGSDKELSYTAFDSTASSYTWSLPPNVQITWGQGTRNIIVKIMDGFAFQTNRQIRVTSSNGIMQVFYLTAQAPVTPQFINFSDQNICPGLGTGIQFNYRIPRVPAASSYLWSSQLATTQIFHPAGTGPNDTIVNISFSSSFTSSYVNVQALNNCGVSNIRSLMVYNNAPPVPCIIDGPTNVCEYVGESATTAIYSVCSSENVTTFNWTLPAGATHISGLGTAVVSFKFPNGYTGGSISVNASNGCGISDTRNLTLNVLQPAYPSQFDVINLSACPNRIFSYALASMPYNATSLLWSVPTGATIISGQGTTNIIVSYPPTFVNGTVSCMGVNNCGTGSSRNIYIKLPPCEQTTKSSFQNSQNNVGVDSSCERLHL